jgi:SulP family sulfate permease
MFSSLKISVRRRYSFAAVQADILAGLTVGGIALPLSMALAIASGVPPQHGLYTAIAAGIVIALTGGSEVNISGPTAAFVVVLLPIVQQFGFGGLLLSGLLAGIILILLGLGRLGKLIEVVPYSVTVGFTAGIGVVIGTFQIKDFLGLRIEHFDGHYTDKLLLLLRGLPTLDWREFLIGGLTLTVLILWPRLRSRVPGHLVALLVGSVAAWLFSRISGSFSVATIGSRFHYQTAAGTVGSGIPNILPSFAWPWNLPAANGQPLGGFSFELVRTLLPSAITIALLGAIESLLCAVVADGMAGKKHNPNDELIGQGIGNIVCSLFGGIPATAAIARTAANVRAGGRSPLASVVHGLFILAAILSLSPLLAYIPMASMAALLLMVAWNMSEAKHFVRTVRVAPRDDVFVLITCFLLTVLFDMTIAVAVGMGLAAALFIQRSISLTSAAKLDDEEQNGLPAGVAVYRINGPLFFGSAQKALKNLAVVTPDVQAVILEMSAVSMIDMSAMVAMESIAETLRRSRIALVINSLQPHIIVQLRRAGIRRKPGQIQFSDSLEEALERAEAMIAPQNMS